MMLVGEPMGTLIQDVRFGVRMLAKNPGFTAVAVATLALGIGANTAIFSVVNSVLLRPLAYRESQQLYLIQVIWRQMAKFYPLIPANLPGFRIWQRDCHSFESIAIAEGASADLTGAGEAVEIHGARSSANIFDVLGVRPALGRSFLPEEDEPGRGRVVVLTDEFGAVVSTLTPPRSAGRSRSTARPTRLWAFSRPLFIFLRNSASSPAFGRSSTSS